MGRNTAKQLKFHGQGFEILGPSFGGSMLKSHPKTRRPLDSKLPIHLTLRAQRSCLRTPTTIGKVNTIVQTTARRYGVRIYSYVNVGNHLHLLIKISKRARWAAFIRDLCGQIALFVRKSLNFASTESFWLYRPFTRVVQGWRRAFKIAKSYLYLNQLEADGMISRGETKTLKDLRALWSG